MSDLLDAQVPVKDIMKIVKCSRSLIFKVKKKKKDGEDLSRKAGSGGHNKIVDDEFLSGVASEIEAVPTRSMRKMAKDLRVSEGTIRKAVGILGAHSYVRRRRQLLTTATKNSRVERGKRLLSWLKKKSPSTVLIFCSCLCGIIEAGSVRNSLCQSQSPWTRVRTSQHSSREY